MMCLWNAANGPSIHAELIGRAWVKMGHKLMVFSAKSHPDARPTFQEDEDFVIRNFTVKKIVPFTRASYFDASPILENDYDIFVAQNVERLPAEKLLGIFPEIKEKALTVMVVHEGKLPDDPLYGKFDWDAVVCFDERYKEFLVKIFPSEIIHTIPYPCHPLKTGNKNKARKKLGFSPGEKIVFSFGFRPEDVVVVLPALKDLSNKFPLRYVVIANPESDVELLLKAKKQYSFIDLRVKPVPLDELYIYLHSSDVLLIHRESSRKYRAVLSSSVCQVLGSGCPVLFHESNFVELHKDEIIKYSDFEDMKSKLIDIFNGKFDINKVKIFLEKNSADVIAKRYIDLFEKLLMERRK